MLTVAIIVAMLATGDKIIYKEGECFLLTFFVIINHKI
jgi:hypothetical protein